MLYVQSFIANISFPTSLAELYSSARSFNVEEILGCDLKHMNSSYEERTNDWTAPKWCKKGDIVFFMHAKTADHKIRVLKKQLVSQKDSFSNDAFWLMMNALIRAKKLYDTYGGKIFAVGRVSGVVEFDASDFDRHWKSNIYAPIDSIFLLENPIDISQFNSVILVSRQSSITPVFGESFAYLKNLILAENPYVEGYLTDSVAEPMPLARLDDSNWLEVVNRHRRSFFLESQFRAFYTDRLLRRLGDNKTFYTECPCKRSGHPICYVDYVIRFQGRYLPTEVKLSVSAERDIVSQLRSYCNSDHIMLSSGKDAAGRQYAKNVMVIDTDNVYMYDDGRGTLRVLFRLDDIKTDSDIFRLREVISNELAAAPYNRR